MKQFNLDEYLRLKEEGKEPRIVTREGENVRILCTNRKGKECPIIALCECGEGEFGGVFTANGIYLASYGESNRDLFFADMEEEPKYRPFKDAEECFNEVRKHGGWVISGGTQYRQITGIGYGCYTNIVKMNSCNWMKFEELLEAVWADDKTPCGIKED